MLENIDVRKSHGHRVFLFHIIGRNQALNISQFYMSSAKKGFGVITRCNDER